MVSLPRSRRQGGGGAPVLRPALAGGRRCLQSAAASSPLRPTTVGGDREWCLRPGAPPPPCASRVACHAFACLSGAWVGGLGHGRRHHSRWPRPVHEQTLLMAQRLRTENGAPRAWAGERAPGHLPLLHACTQPAPHGPLLAAPGPHQPTARRERQPLTVHRLSSQAVRRTLNLGVGFLAANFVQRAESRDPQPSSSPSLERQVSSRSYLLSSDPSAVIDEPGGG
jgi:hypothetical protein